MWSFGAYGARESVRRSACGGGGVEKRERSQTGTRTRVCWVRASYPNHLNYLGVTAPRLDQTLLTTRKPLETNKRHQRQTHATISSHTSSHLSASHSPTPASTRIFSFPFKHALLQQNPRQEPLQRPTSTNQTPRTATSLLLYQAMPLLSGARTKMQAPRQTPVASATKHTLQHRSVQTYASARVLASL